MVTIEKTIRYLENINLDITINGINVKVISFAKLEAGRDWSVINHCHSDFEFHLVPNGKGYINIEGEEFTVNKGEFYITGPYVMHSQVSDREMPMEEYCLECEINFLDTYISEDIIASKENELLKNVLYTPYTYIFKDIYNSIGIFEEIINENLKRIPGFFLNVQSLIISLIISLIRSVIKFENSIYKYTIPEKSIDSFRINRIINFVELNYKRNISLNDIAKVLFLSQRQINRIMLKESGLTFHGYLLNHRIMVAKKLIKSTNKSMEEIAYESGFSSHYYMDQVFKHMGLGTPSSLRR